MSIDIVYIISFLIVGFATVSTKKIVLVSQNKTAVDGPTCGTQKNPCRNIKYAIEQISETDDTVVIDGGCGRYSYLINSTIFINKPITITSLQNCVIPQKAEAEMIAPDVISSEQLSNHIFSI